jgi:ATP-binding cassette subfamily B protein
LVALLTRVYGPLSQLSNTQISLLTMLVSFDRLFEVLDLRPLITERPGARALPVSRPGDGRAPAVEFDHVWFRYPAAHEVSLASLESIALPERNSDGDGWTLRDVTFHAPAGQLTALVGPSGAGKTTITQLVPRLYDITRGSVRVGGQDVRDLTLASLNSTVGVVTQDPHLFHDTVRANLAFASPDASERDMMQACQAAQIWDTVSMLPDGLDTVVGDRGQRLSGGEKQRLSLARLLLKAPSVIVLDEATAHLDTESERAVQQALKTALAGRTSLVIAHRLSTIAEATQILVIEDGRIRECGTHQELLEAGGRYNQLYRTQFAGQSPPQNGVQQGAMPRPARTTAWQGQPTLTLQPKPTLQAVAPIHGQQHAEPRPLAAGPLRLRGRPEGTVSPGSPLRVASSLQGSPGDPSRQIPLPSQIPASSGRHRSSRRTVRARRRRWATGLSLMMGQSRRTPSHSRTRGTRAND